MKLDLLASGCILAAALALLQPASAVAQGSFGTSIGTFNDWVAFTGTEGNAKVCYVGAKPQKSTGNYQKRDDVYVLVTHRPSAKSMGIASVEAGYAYKEGSDAEIAIEGGKTFKFYTKDGQAWAYDNDDAQVIAAMKGGKSMTIKGTSNRGTATVDVYSLAGFTAAMAAIDKACPAPK